MIEGVGKRADELYSMILLESVKEGIGGKTDVFEEGKLESPGAFTFGMKRS